MTNKDDMTKTERRIYITKNARMISEKRLKFYSFWLNFGVSFSSIIITMISIIILVKNDYDKDHIFTFMLIFYSLLICTTSLIIWQRNFDIRARNFRKCYLKLDYILSKYKNNEEKLLKKYHEILKRFENHETIDNLEARLEYNRKNKDSKCYPLPNTQICEYYFKKYIYYVIYIFVLFSPIFYFIYICLFKKQ